MTKIKFSKPKSDSYAIYSGIGVILSIFIFANLNVSINKPVAYLLVSVFSFFSILSAARNARLECEEIIIEKESVSFCFHNILKPPLHLKKDELFVQIEKESILFKNSRSNKLIAKALKKRILEPASWEILLAEFRSGQVH